MQALLLELTLNGVVGKTSNALEGDPGRPSGEGAVAVEAGGQLEDLASVGDKGVRASGEI